MLQSKLLSIDVLLSSCNRFGRGGVNHRTVPIAVANKKAELSQRWPRDAPYIWVPWKFPGVPGPWLLFPNFL